MTAGRRDYSTLKSTDIPKVPVTNLLYNISDISLPRISSLSSVRWMLLVPKSNPLHYLDTAIILVLHLFPSVQELGLLYIQ